MITFEKFILRQMVRRDTQYNQTSCRFIHASNDIGHGTIVKKIQEEGQLRGYTKDRICQECDDVVNKLGQLMSRTKRNVFSFEIKDHLPLGGLVEVSGHLHQSPKTEPLTLLLMRVDSNRFLVVESTQPNSFHPATVYSLEKSTFLSTIQGRNPTPFLFRNKSQAVQLIISNLNFIIPSEWEQVLDSELTNHVHGEVEKKKNSLHPNPMSLLFHEYSSTLPNYIDIKDGQPTEGVHGIKEVSDITEFINAIKTYINGSNSANEVERKYPDWFQFCAMNGISIMSLDTLVNKLWKMKGTL